MGDDRSELDQVFDEVVQLELRLFDLERDIADLSMYYAVLAKGDRHRNETRLADIKQLEVEKVRDLVQTKHWLRRMETKLDTVWE